MTKEKIIEIIKNELECVRTASDNKCNRDCENCKLVRDSDDIIKAYDFVIEMLEQESVLDKIRAEIEKLDYLTIEDGSDGYDHYVDKYDVLKIINKYRVESEG